MNELRLFMSMLGSGLLILFIGGPLLMWLTIKMMVALHALGLV
jgi:hypothetical protein